MHVFGACFTDHASAAAALVEIRERVTVAPGDVAVRPMGSTNYEAPTQGFLLAGRFADDDVDAVAEIAEAHGGLIIERRLEWPHLRRGAGRRSVGSASGASAQPRCLV